jgi:phage gpG-like protein
MEGVIMMKFQITEDSREVALRLDRLSIQKKGLQNRIMRRIAKPITTGIKAELQGAVLNRITGETARTIRYKITKTGMYIGSFLPWTGVHEHGYEGRNAMGKRMNIPRRPFVWPIIESIFHGDAERIGEEAMQEWIEEKI